MTGNPLEKLSPYDLRHLVAHLVEAGRAQEAHRLLALEYMEGARVQNAWYAARYAALDMAGYLEDLERARHLAEVQTVQQVDQGHPASGLGLEARYALLLASVNSLAGNMPASLVIALAQKGLWPVDQALSFARQNPDPQERAEALAALAPALSPEECRSVLDEAVQASRQVDGQELRGRALAVVAVHLEGAEKDRIIQEALEVAGSFEDEFGAPQALAEVALFLEEPQRTQVLDQALGRAYGLTREAGYWVAVSLGKMAPHLNGQQLQKALSIGDMIEDESNRAQAMEELALYLPREAVQMAMRSLQYYYEVRWRDSARAALEPRVLDPQKALAKMRRGEYGEWTGTALASISDRLTTEIQEEALAVLADIEEYGHYLHAVTAVAPRLPDLALALHTTLEIGERGNRWQAMRVLAARLDQATLWQAVQDISRLSGNDERASLMEILLPYIPAEWYPQVLGAVSQILDGHWQAVAAVPNLKLFLDEERSEEVAELLVRTMTAEDPIFRQRAFEALAPHLQDEHWPKALEGMALHQGSASNSAPLAFFEALIGDYHANDALEAFIPYLPGWAWQQVEEFVLKIKEDGPRVAALEKLVPFHPDLTGLVKLLQLGGLSRKAALTIAAPRLPNGQFGKAFQNILAIEDEKEKEKRLIAVAPRLDGEQAIQVLKSAERFSGMRAIKVLEAMVPQLKTDQAAQAIQWVRSFSYEGTRVEAMVVLIPRLDPQLRIEILQDAIDLACRLENWLARAENLARVSPQLTFLPERDRGRAVRKIRKAIDRMQQRDDPGAFYRALALAALAQVLPEKERLDMLEEALALIPEISRMTEKVRVLRLAGPQLPVNRLASVFGIALDVQAKDDPRGEETEPAWACLAPRLAELPPGEACRLARLALRGLETGARPAMLRALAELAVPFLTLGGPQAAQDLLKAIMDTGRWWP